MTDSRRVETLADTRRMVVKVGTNVLAGKPFGKRRIAALASQVAELSARGISVVMVSSGAIGAGMQQLGLARRPERLPGLQAAAAVGQTQLMKMWDASLGRRGLTSAQVLLTRDDCSHRRRYLNARN
ncbi:MAG: glutamate 5-kinase, partial [Planctomycetota bacterium]